MPKRFWNSPEKTQEPSCRYVSRIPTIKKKNISMGLTNIHIYWWWRLNIKSSRRSITCLRRGQLIKANLSIVIDHKRSSIQADTKSMRWRKSLETQKKNNTFSLYILRMWWESKNEHSIIPWIRYTALNQPQLKFIRKFSNFHTFSLEITIIIIIIITW